MVRLACQSCTLSWIGVQLKLHLRLEYSDALATDGSFPLAKVAAKQMTVFYSPKDEALGKKFQVAEASATRTFERKNALGLY